MERSNSTEPAAENPSESPTPEELRLLETADRAATRAYAPYSKIHVGAALLDKNGEIHTGCNVENVSYGLTICAERVALTRAVADGHRDFVAIAVVANTPQGFPPCGACRQVLAEFAPALRVVWRAQDGIAHSASLGDLLGHMLTPKDLPADNLGRAESAGSNSIGKGSKRDAPGGRGQ